MKTATPELKALLLTGRYVKADLWTITLRGGAVTRWTSADKPIKFGGNTFALGPLIKRGGIKEKMGLETSTLELNVAEKNAVTLGGVPLIKFIKDRGLDGANVKLEQAFMPTWEDPVTGTLIRFAGRVTSVGGIGGSNAEVIVSSWAILLNTAVPVNVYQAGCMHSVYDAGCGLSEAAFTGSDIMGTGSTRSVLVTSPVLAQDYVQGRIVITSGSNAGISRTIKSISGNNVHLLNPLPSAPAAGNTFNVSYGCDQTRGVCTTRFNNLIRHKATPFVPIPETAVP